MRGCVALSLARAVRCARKSACSNSVHGERGGVANNARLKNKPGGTGGLIKIPRKFQRFRLHNCPWDERALKLVVEFSRVGPVFYILFKCPRKLI